jgi:hypothetical protein
MSEVRFGPGGVPDWLEPMVRFCSRCGTELTLRPDRGRGARPAGLPQLRLRLLRQPAAGGHDAAGHRARRGHAHPPRHRARLQPCGPSRAASWRSTRRSATPRSARRSRKRAGQVEPGAILGLYSRVQAAVVVVAFEARIVGGEPLVTRESLETRPFAPDAIPWPRSPSRRASGPPRLGGARPAGPAAAGPGRDPPRLRGLTRRQGPGWPRANASCRRPTTASTLRWTPRPSPWFCPRPDPSGRADALRPVRPVPGRPARPRRQQDHVGPDHRLGQPDRAAALLLRRPGRLARREPTGEHVVRRRRRIRSPDPGHLAGAAGDGRRGRRHDRPDQALRRRRRRPGPPEPDRPERQHLRLPGAQRGRQDDDSPAPDRPRHARPGRAPWPASIGGTGGELARNIGYLDQDPRFYGWMRAGSC